MSEQEMDRPDPADDPFACSSCGCHLGTGQRLRGDDYCDPCAREHGFRPPMRTCLGCGGTTPQEQMEPVDVSPSDEYYPEIRYLCRGCQGGSR